MSNDDDLVFGDNPQWLTHMLDQRLAQLKEFALPRIPPGMYDAIVLTLTDPADESPATWAAWQWTCDHCGKVHRPESPEFASGSASRQLDDEAVVQITFGACITCLKLP